MGGGDLLVLGDGGTVGDDEVGKLRYLLLLLLLHSQQVLLRLLQRSVLVLPSLDPTAVSLCSPLCPAGAGEQGRGRSERKRGKEEGRVRKKREGERDTKGEEKEE